MRIPPLVPSQSCCARQLPQRGSQGDILSSPNLSIRKLSPYLSTSKRGVFHLPALPDGKPRLSLDGRIIAPNAYFVNMLLVLFFSFLKKINDPGGKGHGDQGVGDSAERNIGQ